MSDTEENDPSPGQIRPDIPDHELLRVIGSGSYGEVWLARTLFGQYRAVKVVRRSAFTDSKPFDREFSGLKRFEPLSRSHDAFVPILHVGRDPGDTYFYCVMDLADDRSGTTEILPESYSPKTAASEIEVHGHLSVEETVRIGLNLAAGLAFLHGNGLVHRDIKPTNIVFIRGLAKLADIGLVHTIEQASTMVGTQGYIPPEGPGTIQADIYSLGKVLYELGTGHDRQQFPELPDFALTTAEGRPLSELNEMLITACHQNPASRYATAEALQSDLELLQAGHSLRRLRHLERRWKRASRLVGTGLIALLVLGGLGWFFYAQRTQTAQARFSQHLTSVNYGARLIEEGRYFQSLPWFVESLGLVEPNTTAHTNTRSTIATLLRASPQLRQCWWMGAGVHAAQFSQDGGWVAAGLFNGDGVVFNTTNGQRLCTVRHGADGRPVLYAFVNPAFTRLVTVGRDSKNRLWSLPDGKPIAYLNTFNNTFHGSFSPDGRSIFLCGAKGKLTEWDADTAQFRRAFVGHNGQVHNVNFSPDGTRLLSCGSDNRAVVWDLATARPTLEIRDSSWVNFATFSPDGKWIATAGFNRNARVWDSSTGQPASPVLTHPYPLSCAAFTSNSQELAVSTQSGEVTLWNFASGEKSASVMSHGSQVEIISISPDGRNLLSASYDGTIRLWDITPWRPSVDTRRFSEDGLRCLLLQSNSLQFFQGSSPTPDRGWTAPYPVRQTAVSESGSRLLALPEPGAKKPLAGFDLQRQREFSLPAEANREAAQWVVAEGAPVAASAAGPSVEIWNLDSHQRLARIIHTQNVATIKLSRDGRFLGISLPFVVQVVRTEDGRALFTTERHALATLSLTFSRDSSRLLTGCLDGTGSEGYARVWDVPSGQAISPRLPHNDGILSLAFSPDGARVATGGEDFQARVWAVKDGQALPPFQHKDQVTGVRFDESGRRLMSSSRDRTIRLWDLETVSALTPPLLHPQQVQRVFLPPPYEYLGSEDFEGRIRLWPIHPETNALPLLERVTSFLSGKRVAMTESERQAVGEMLQGYR